MPQYKQFPLPDVGEGLTEAEILAWHVAPGDTVTVNQLIVEIETAKAAVELPSPWSGVVTELLARPGDTVDVGRPIVTIDIDPGGPAPAGAKADDVAKPAGAEEAASGGKIGEEMPGGRIATLVGYGPRSAIAKRRPRKGAPGSAGGPGGPGRPGGVGGPGGAVPAEEPAAIVRQAVQTSAERAPSPTPDTQPAVAQLTDVAAAARPSPNGAGGHVPLAKPPVRKLARDLGVDLRALSGSGPSGVITREDVHRAATEPLEAPLDRTQPVAAVAGEPSVEPAAYDPATRERRVPIRGVRKATAAAMVRSAFTAPHVTEFLAVDVTPMMELRSRLRASGAFADVKITPLTFAAKAVCLAVRRTPDVNATWDEETGEIVYKDYVHLGIAAATPRGLVVPKIRDADRMSLRELAAALEELTTAAREGKTAPADMLGGTITITNVGVFGVDTGTPIINPGESAILALGAIRELPWVVDGQIVPRRICQLALSFDHRVVDGQQGSQFLADVGAILADPAMAITY
ncbi:MAG TPA: dihydrolipoamide acetyltransferase family protein [Pseudonocardiaceae bacterium]|jgi:pyruvate dehydrogenase E2 component (dihydrolipoamide acetyltransferase)